MLFAWFRKKKEEFLNDLRRPYTMYCTCEDWKKGNHSLVEAMTLARDMGYVYNGTVWRYCPWCSKSLKKEYQSEQSK